MIAVGGILILVGMVLALVGLIRLLIPKLKSRRKNSRNVLLAGVATFFLGAIVTPSPTVTAQQRAADVAIAAKSDADGKAIRASEQKLSKQKLQGEAAMLWKDILREAAPCDAAGEAIATAAKASNMYSLYEAASLGETACSEASTNISRLDPPPSASGEISEGFENAIEKCGLSQVSKQIAYSKLAEVANGDQRPSAVLDAKEKMKTAGMGGMYCAAGIMDVIGKAGLDTKLFEATS